MRGVASSSAAESHVAWGEATSFGAIAPHRVDDLGGKLMRNHILLAGAAALTVALSVEVATATAGGGKSANARVRQLRRTRRNGRAHPADGIDLI